MKVIARIQSAFPEKFGIPRQSGLVKELQARIVFELEYRNADAVRGLDEFSHLWLIWEFSEAKRDTWSPTVRPPRLGGNQRLGVFATRSPYRPNPVGLSCVKLERVELDSALGPVIHVQGADLMDGTPIFDIKPYIPYADCHPDAVGGFASDKPEEKLQVDIPEEFCSVASAEVMNALRGVLAQDPRPAYQKDPERIYGLSFAGMEVRFQVDGDKLIVRGIEIKK